MSRRFNKTDEKLLASQTAWVALVATLQSDGNVNLASLMANILGFEQQLYERGYATSAKRMETYAVAIERLEQTLQKREESDPENQAEHQEKPEN